MTIREIDSFVVKFKYLLNAGFEASLKFSSRNGEAIATLEANLGGCNSEFNRNANGGHSPNGQSLVNGFGFQKTRGMNNRGPS